MSEETTEAPADLKVDPASLPALVDYYRNRAYNLELEFINFQVISQQEIARLQSELADLREPEVIAPAAKSSNKRTTG